MITKLKDNQIFVFGSNLNGEHLGGAARQAFNDFCAEWGISEGITGQCYAFPTLDENMNKQNRACLLDSIVNLIDTCECNQDKIFLMTSVGTGIAGFSISYISGLFNLFKLPKNLVMPLEWTIINNQNDKD